MPPTNGNDPSRATDHEPGAGPPAPEATTGHPPGSAPDEVTVTFLPGEGTEPMRAASGRGPAAVSVPGYEIQSVLGRDGMGVVYKARHLTLKRTVALKMILRGGHAGPGELARFRIEAEAAARLQHPNIVQIHEVGEAGGHPYCALEFVEGGNLAGKLGGKPLPAREAAVLVEALARAMQLAHSRNVVHRDLKPANVLLAADGTPKITDFGLARRLDSDSGETQVGAVIGTPAYMAPEQAEGHAHEAGPAADVYALGAILYECLTGRPPFLGKTSVETLDRVRTQEPLPPRRWQKSVPPDLETICLKCLRKEPEKRYASAAELADELARYRQGEPILARPVGRAERAVKWVRRNPAPAALAAAVLLVTALGMAGVVWKYLDAERQKGIALEKEGVALQEAAKATKARDFLVSIFKKAETNEKGGNVTVRQLLDDAEAEIPDKFAGQPELSAELVKAIGEVKRGIARRVPRAMILEVRGAVQVRSAAGEKRAAAPQTLVHLDDRLSLSPDAEVRLVFLSDLHQERVKAGREVTVGAKGCEPADVVRERDASVLMTFVRLPKGTFYMGWGGAWRREDGLAFAASTVPQGQPFAAAAFLTSQQAAPGRGWKTDIEEDFEIAAHDVTQGQWEAVMGNNPSWFSRKGKSWRSVQDLSDEELKLFPVEMVSWDDAQEFLKKLNEQERGRGYFYRLPSEAEWEYACRGGATSLAECSHHFYFDKPTNDLSSAQANFDGNYPFGKANKGPYLLRPTRVGAYPPNRLGLCDMHGNVRQWTSSREGSVRVYRGGDWHMSGSNCRAGLRTGDEPTTRYSHIGFRLARVPVTGRAR